MSNQENNRNTSGKNGNSSTFNKNDETQGKNNSRPQTEYQKPVINRGATPKIRSESTTSRALNFDDTDSCGSRFAKLTVNPGRSSSEAGLKISKSASSSPSHSKLQHQQSQPVTQRCEQFKNHPIRTSASASNVTFGSGGSSSIQLRKTSYKNQHSHSLRYSGSGSDVSNLVSILSIYFSRIRHDLNFYDFLLRCI